MMFGITRFQSSILTFQGGSDGTSPVKQNIIVVTRHSTFCHFYEMRKFSCTLCEKGSATNAEHDGSFIIYFTSINSKKSFINLKMAMAWRRHRQRAALARPGQAR